MPGPISGIHHITAIASKAQRNFDFYTQVLGLRLVKRTVNFDDPGSYHFYFGDERGSPGTILTFFAWESREGPARQGRGGVSQVVTVCFAVPQGSIPAWEKRLQQNGASTGAPFQRFGEQVLPLFDPDRLPLELVEIPGAGEIHAWETGPVEKELAVRGFAAPVLLVQEDGPTLKLLQEVMGFQQAAEAVTHADGSRRTRLAATGSQGLGFQPGSQVDVVCRPKQAGGQIGAGVVHHIAFRARDDQEQAEWLQSLRRLGLQVTPVQDRQYFHSIYFREPGGILFEIATDPPGFTLDEPLEKLGSDLKLPLWLEENRREIERILPALDGTG